MSSVLPINADAAWMPLADESVGMILTSPPWNVGLNYDGWIDDMPEDEYREFIRKFLSEAYRVTKDTGRAYFIVGDMMLWWFRELAESVGWSFYQLLIWCKPNLIGTGKRNSGDWTRMAEWIMLFRKGKRTPMRNGFLLSEANTFNWFIETAPQTNFKEGRIHPAQLPISLCMKIIDRTPGNPILDPFMGSGSVMVAAKKLGRPSIGIELVPVVTKRAVKRIRRIKYQERMFIKTLEQADLPLFKDTHS